MANEAREISVGLVIFVFNPLRLGKIVAFEPMEVSSCMVLSLSTSAIIIRAYSIIPILFVSNPQRAK